jgi:hypothetical protein
MTKRKPAFWVWPDAEGWTAIRFGLLWFALFPISVVLILRWVFGLFGWIEYCPDCG